MKGYRRYIIISLFDSIPILNGQSILQPFLEPWWNCPFRERCKFFYC